MGRLGRAVRAACLVAVAASVTNVATLARPADSHERIGELLLTSPSALSGQLASLGQDALPALFEVLAERSFAVEGTSYELSPSQREAVVRAVGRIPSRFLKAYIEELSDPAASVDLKQAAVEILGTHGGAGDLRSLIDVTETEAGDVRERGLARELERSLARVLERDGRGYSLLGTAIYEAHPAAREPIVRAMGVARTAVAVDPLGGMLGAYPDVDLAILGQLARISARQRLIPSRDTLERVRPYLSSEDVHVRCTAALVLGRFEDFESVPRLIELVDHKHQGLRSQALWSLRKISGLGLRPEAERWQMWYQRELEWWETSSDELFEELRSVNAAVAVQAVNEVTRRRLFRNEIADELTRALDHKDPRVALQACDALRQLASPSAVPALINCLVGTEETVQQAAWSTLKEITGCDLPLDPQQWRAAFPG